VDEILKKRRTLQETMNFMAALSAGIEPILGRGANSMTMSAGRNLGRKFPFARWIIGLSFHHDT